MENIIPQHQVFAFDDGVVIRSDFDSGNLARAERVGQQTYHLWTGPDCMGSAHENTCRTWFYFRVSVKTKLTLTLTIKNLNLQSKLFREGMRPVVKTPSSPWKRVEGPLTTNIGGESGNMFEVTWLYNFDESEASFAFTYPWSYAETIALNDAIMQMDINFYIHRELLIHSLEGRRCEILTISSHKGITNQFENNLPDLFPEREQPPALFRGKPIVFISSRVHPGETPGSHAMNGFLRFIVSDDPRAIVLRDEFVFKIVPIINPDGVFRGHYRTDTQGLNLNRFYNAPTLAQHPTIYAIRELFLYYHQNVKEGIFCYIDLHAHASKRACFMYGNYMEFPKQVETCLLAKLIALNCANFDFEGSNFTEKNMMVKDKRDGLSKEGSGRVALYKLTNLTRCYTLECNYNAGHVLNRLVPSGLPERPEADTDTEMYMEGPPFYTQEMFEDVGMAIGIAILDCIMKNPYSRILPQDPQLRNLKFEVGTFISKIVPFRFDSKLKKSIRNLEDFENYMNGKDVKKKEEKKVAKKKPPMKPSRIITQKTEGTVSKKYHQASSASSSDSYKSLEPRPKDVKALPLKNFEFVKPKEDKPPERGRQFAGKKHLQQLSSLSRHDTNKKFKEDNRTSSIPPRKRL